MFKEPGKYPQSEIHVFVTLSTLAGIPGLSVYLFWSFIFIRSIAILEGL
jgi:hypothetical protein